MATMSATLKKASKTDSKNVEKNGTKSIHWPQFNPYTMPQAHIRHCKISASTFTVEMDDGRTLHAPTVALEPVCGAPWNERRRFRVVDNGLAVEWPALGYKVTLRQLMGVE